MNMPVLPVTSPSPPSAEAPARGADAAATDAPAFSNVLSQQRDGAAARPAESRQTGKTGDRADADAAERREPLGPDETLSLILDSAALPLMQAAVPTAETRPVHAASASRTGAADRAIPRADAPAPADAREPGRARAATAQSHAQSAGQALAAQAAAGSQAAEPSAHARSASGPETIQAPAPTAALASAAAPAGASLLPAAAPAPATASVAVPTPLSNPQWPQDFSRQILHLTQNLAGTGNTVQMHVNPPELGPIHITLHVGDSIAQASFVSPHASVRQALENALPHLEQQLAQAGLSLGQADVGSQQSGQQAYAQGQAQPSRDGGSTFSLDGQAVEAASLPAASPAPRTVSRPDALVDTFA